MSIGDGYRFGVGFIFACFIMGVVGALFVVSIGWTRRPFLYVDPSTGCQYLAPMHANGGITPRLDADGKIMCGGGDDL